MKGLSQLKRVNKMLGLLRVLGWKMDRWVEERVEEPGIRFKRLPIRSQ